MISLLRSAVLGLIAVSVLPLARLAALDAAAVPVEPAPAGLVLNGRVDAHWLPDGWHFWYRRQESLERSSFVLVDAVQATSRPAFDHQRMAQALAAALGRPVDAGTLPIDQLDAAEGERSLLLSVDGRWWACDLATYELRRSDHRHALPLEAEPRPSREGGQESWVRFRNRTAGEVEIVWVAGDGHYQVYATVPAGGEHLQSTYAGHVWLARTRSGAPLGVVEAPIGGGEVVLDGTPPAAPPARVDPDRSPDGAWRAIIRDHNLWLRPRSGEPVQLSTDGRADDAYQLPVAWSPDSTRLAALRVQPGQNRTITLVESSPADQLQPKVRVVPYAKPGDRIAHPRPQLFLVGERRQVPVGEGLFPEPWSIDELRWNPDGRAFTFAYNQRGHQLLRIIAVDGTSGATRAIVEERSPTFIDYAGKRFCEYLDATHELIWMSERDGWNHLYLYDAASGAVEHQITRGAWVVRGVDRVDPESRRIWFRAGGLRPGEDPYLVHHARVDFDGGNLVVLTEGAGTHDLAWSPDHRFAIDTWSRADAPPVSVLRDGETGRALRTLERADASALTAAGWQLPEPAVAKGRDGVTDIHGLVWKPRHLDAGRRYPVIECIYAGPQSAYVPKAFLATSQQQRLADLGFVVVMCDCLGTSQRSKAFHDVCWKNLGDAGLPDRIPWIRAAAASRPYMDLDRVGIYGGSAGGQNALRALLVHPEFYKAGVADCGCHDNRMDKIWWNELWMGWPVGPHYAEQSNVTQAHRLQGRLLLIVGELDDNVDPASTLQVADALIKAGKDFELLVVPGAGHGAGSQPYGRRRMEEFFARTLR
jgi:dipeptidyl aminopeptidase/acylaminoacyl peptidase